MNISSFIDTMVKKKFALSMPEGSGLMAYLEKGEKGLLRKERGAGRSVHEVRVEDGQLVVPPELEKKLGLEPGSRLDVVLTNGRAEILPNIRFWAFFSAYGRGT